MATYNFILLEVDKDMTRGKRPGGDWGDLQAEMNYLGALGYTVGPTKERSGRMYIVMQLSSDDP